MRGGPGCGAWLSVQECCMEVVCDEEVVFSTFDEETAFR